MMVRILSLLFVFALYQYLGSGHVLASSGGAPKISGIDTQATSALARDFTDNAMAEFDSLGSMLSPAVISSRIEEYAMKVAETLLGSGIGADAAGKIMKEASTWYGQAIAALYRGDNFDVAIKDYSSKVSALMAKEQLSFDAQSKIVSLASTHLERINSIFKGSSQ
jgi:hypothetical protein